MVTLVDYKGDVHKFKTFKQAAEKTKLPKLWVNLLHKGKANAIRGWKRNNKKYLKAHYDRISFVNTITRELVISYKIKYFKEHYNLNYLSDTAFKIASKNWVKRTTYELLHENPEYTLITYITPDNTIESYRPTPQGKVRVR